MAAAFFRGICNSTSGKKGAMAAVGLGKDDVLPYLLPGVYIACENSQLSVTISGDTEAVQSVLQKLGRDFPDVFTRFLRVEKAYHSRKLK